MTLNLIIVCLLTTQMNLITPLYNTFIPIFQSLYNMANLSVFCLMTFDALITFPSTTVCWSFDISPFV